MKSCVRYWVNLYVGYSKKCIDKGSRWRQLLKACVIKQTGSRIEIHNALSVGERYHYFLRSIFRKFQSAHPKVNEEDFQSLPVHAINSIACLKGLVPILIVFRVIPEISLRFYDVEEEQERMIYIKRAIN